MEVAGWLLIVFLIGVFGAMAVSVLDWVGLLVCFLALMGGAVFFGLFFLGYGMIKYGDMVTVWTK